MACGWLMRNGLKGTYSGIDRMIEYCLFVGLVPISSLQIIKRFHRIVLPLYSQYLTDNANCFHVLHGRTRYRPLFDPSVPVTVIRMIRFAWNNALAACPVMVHADQQCVQVTHVSLFAFCLCWKNCWTKPKCWKQLNLIQVYEPFWAIGTQFIWNKHVAVVMRCSHVCLFFLVTPRGHYFSRTFNCISATQC